MAYDQSWKPGDQDLNAEDMTATDDVTAGDDVIATDDVVSVLGDISAVTGDVTAGDDVVVGDDVDASGKIAADEGVEIHDAGAGVSIEASTATNTKLGSAVLVAGTVTVTNSAITANSIVLLTNQLVGGTPGTLSVGTVTPATSFVINSTSGTDTSTVGYMIVEKL